MQCQKDACWQTEILSVEIILWEIVNWVMDETGKQPF